LSGKEWWVNLGQTSLEIRYSQIRII
jgi:hypothetical protein